MALDLIRIFLALGEGCFTLVISIFILQKNSKERLNQIFSLGFLFMTIFFIAQLPLFILGSLGAEAIPYLWVMNLSRDISNASGIFGSACMLLVSFVASRGFDPVDDRRSILTTSFSAVFLLIITILGELNDHVELDIPNSTHVLNVESLGLLICFVLPLILIFLTTAHFGIVWYGLEPSVVKTNVSFFFGGMCIIFTGLLYQAFITIALGSEFFRMYPLFDYLTYFIWGFGELVIGLGFFRKSIE